MLRLVRMRLAWRYLGYKHGAKQFDENPACGCTFLRYAKSTVWTTTLATCSEIGTSKVVWRFDMAIWRVRVRRWTLRSLGSASLAVLLRDRGSHDRRDSTQTTSVKRIAGKQ
jgi:hypothetical protein